MTFFNDQIVILGLILFSSTRKSDFFAHAETFQNRSTYFDMNEPHIDDFSVELECF